MEKPFFFTFIGEALQLLEDGCQAVQHDAFVIDHEMSRCVPTTTVADSISKILGFPLELKEFLLEAFQPIHLELSLSVQLDSVLHHGDHGSKEVRRRSCKHTVLGGVQLLIL